MPLQGEMRLLRARGVNSEGDGLCDCDDGLVVFVPMLLPGEEALVRLVKVKRTYGIGKVLELKTVSPERVKPFCPWFGKCGGCRLQHGSYALQLKIKEELLLDSMVRLGGFLRENLPFHPCVSSPQQRHYRNKASFPVQSFRGVVTPGFFQRDSHRLIPIDCCPLIDPSLEELMRAFREVLPTLSLRAYDERSQGGSLRHILLRKGSHSGQGAILLVLKERPSSALFDELRALARKMRTRFPLFSSWALNIQPDPGNVIIGSRTLPLSGAPYIEERLGEFTFRMDLTAFFQVNSYQAENLYESVRTSLRQEEKGDILELYSGVGSLTAYLASTGRSVTAVESWEPSAHNLEYNMKINKIKNVSIINNRVEDYCAAGILLPFKTVVLDPPRSGTTPEVISAVNHLSPPEILYVSCNPATLARDLRRFVDVGYRLISLTPFDLFPQTAHVETLAILKRAR